MNIKNFNTENISKICILLVVFMLLASMVSRENITSAKEYQSVNLGAQHITSVHGGDFNTEICTTDMLGVRNIAYITGNSKRTYNDAVLRVSAVVLVVQNYLHSISERGSGLHWEVTPQMHSDIFILDFIHRQDGEK